MVKSPERDVDKDYEIVPVSLLSRDYEGKAMLAGSANRTLKGAFLLGLVLASCVGCRQMKPCTQEGEVRTAGTCPEQLPYPQSSRPCAPPAPPQCQPPQVDVRAAPPVHVKLPQQQIVLEQAPAAPPAAPPMMAQPVAPAAPQMVAMPQSYAPMSAPGVIVPAAPVGRARPGIALDFIRIPIPFPRLIAVPTTPEVTIPIAYQPQVPAAPVYAAAPVYPAAPVAPPVQAPVYQVQAPVAPVMAQPVMAQPVVAQPVAVQPVAPQQPQAISPQTLADYCRQIDALKAALDASKAAMGCPK
jgi:hypothetical protein